MTVKEACKQLEISQSTLYHLVAAHRIAHYRIGGKILFRDEDIAAFLAGCRVGTTPEQVAAPPPRLKLKHITLGRDS